MFEIYVIYILKHDIS